MRGTDIACRRPETRCQSLGFAFTGEVPAMHQISYAVERARAIFDRCRRSATMFGAGYRRPKRPGSGGFTRPIDNHEVLTVVLFSVIAILSALDFMLACPDLGVVIAQYNQF
jgi:hypothetical protein